LCNEKSISYDSDGYSKSLDKLVAMSEKEYYVHLVDINRHQLVVARTLLWLAVILIGFDIAIIEWAYTKVSKLPALVPILTPCYFFFIFSIIFGVIAFAFSAIAIPAFGGYKPLYNNSWADYSNSAHEKLLSGQDSIYMKTLNDLLTNLDAACSKGNTTNALRGLKLRVSSILTILSATSAGIGFIIFSFNYYL
jgi:hypothetical protein